MNNNYKDPRCEQQRNTCASNMNGFCSILIDTNFGDRQCPFFRQKKSADKKE